MKRLMKRFRNDNEEKDFEIEKAYNLLNRMIRSDKIKFSFYDSPVSLDVLCFCHNKIENTIECEFRDTRLENLIRL